MEEKIRVAIRVRPCSSNSIGKECISLSPDGQQVCVYTEKAHTTASFRCETYLSSNITQDAVFDTIGGNELVEAALDGFPVTIFAYGQTGAGKSYTIFGKEDASASRSSTVCSHDGLLPRSARHLMQIVESRKEEIEYTLRVTCVEIYNEQVRDLFDLKKESLPVRYSKDHGFYLENATIVECTTAEEVIRVAKLAATNRIKSSHLLNERSNRSHCLVTIYIDSCPKKSDGSAVKKYGKLTIVDLAGSERATDTGAIGQQLKETGHINKSLYCLSQVIKAMVKNASVLTGDTKSKSNTKFVPYRDSKLTMLLIDSLGGNSKTLMLACVNGASQFATESIRTLEFAMGVAKIKNRPTAVLNPHEKLIIDLKEQIRLLKLENMMLRSRTPGYFLEHPLAVDTIMAIDPNLNPLGSELTTSPLSKALLSSRQSIPRRLEIHRDEYESNNNHVEVTDIKSDTFTGSPASQLEKITKVRQVYAQKKKGYIIKKRNKPSVGTTPFIQNDVASFVLPPVTQSTFRTAPLSENRMPATTKLTSLTSNLQGTGVLGSIESKNRPITPPPEYNDLFGIETIPVSTPSLIKKHSSRLMDAIASTAPPECTKPAQRDRISACQSTGESPLSPREQIQQLLREMMSPSTTPITVSPNQREPQESASNIPRIAFDTPQFDDARAQDLFQQLCRL